MLVTACYGTRTLRNQILGGYRNAFLRCHVPSLIANPALPRAGASGVLLLVEDDPDHAFLVRRQLREQLPSGFEIAHVATAGEATERLGQGGVRCVVLDLSLPDATGLEAVRAVHAADPTVAIVVLTGMDSDELGLQALQLGAQDYLVKGQHGPDVVRRSVVLSLERAERHAAEQGLALFAHRLQLVLEASAEGICMLDGDGVMSFANRTAADLFGVAADDLVGRSLHEFHVCADRPCLLEQQLKTRDRLDAGEQLFRSPEGQTSVLEVRTRALYDLGTGSESVVNLTDVTSRRRALDALAEREAQLVEAQQLAHLGSWEWVPATDDVLWSDEMYRVTGLSRDDVPEDVRAFTVYTDLVPLPEQPRLRPLFDAWTAERSPVDVVHQLVRPDGSLRWLQCRASVREEAQKGTDKPALHIVGTVQDITEQKVAEDALAHQAMHDALTGLPNRALLLDRLDRMLANTRRKTVALVFMDIDRFKWVNDSMTHAAGDALLVAVAERLAATLRPADTLARTGGDEFVLVCDGLDTEDQVIPVLDRLSRALVPPLPVDGRELTVTMSMGLAVAAAGEDVDSESLIRDADIAMYRAKESGRARYEIFDEAMRQRASRRLEVQADLHRALQSGEVLPWYQPIVELGTERVVGCEALARWCHPDKGLLLPDSFIPHAEETGEIVAIDGAVLTEACRQVAEWNRGRPTDDPLTLSVNVSARQLSSLLLVETVSDALEPSGLPPEQLCLEVTESVVMEDVTVSGKVLGQLRDLGVRTAVDDFGKGYSSLAYLLSLPVDLLKIDLSFVRVLDAPDGPAVAIVRAIAALGEALDIEVLAEGVESQQQHELLSELGVEQGQGFLWGRAVPHEQASWATWPSRAVRGGPQAGVPVQRAAPDAHTDTAGQR